MLLNTKFIDSCNVERMGYKIGQFRITAPTSTNKKWPLHEDFNWVSDSGSHKHNSLLKVVETAFINNQVDQVRNILLVQGLNTIGLNK